MCSFVSSFLDSIGRVDGFILKSRSPSCGTRDAKIYSGAEEDTSIAKGGGFFGGAALRKFPHLAVEDERRLKNLKIRARFLEKLFGCFEPFKLWESLSKEY